MCEPHVGIIVLAAGASHRMGTPKQLISLQGLSLIQRAAKTAIDSTCHPIVIVLGANADLIQPELLHLLGVRIAINNRWAAGMATSIRCGLTTLLTAAPQIDGVILMAADQPDVTGDSVQRLLHAYRRLDSGPVAAHFNDVLGTPALFSRQYFAELLQLEGQEGARSLLVRHRERVRAIELPEAARDLDTPKDVIAFLAQDSSASEFPPLRSRG